MLEKNRTWLVESETSDNFELNLKFYLLTSKNIFETYNLVNVIENGYPI